MRHGPRPAGDRFPQMDALEGRELLSHFGGPDSFGGHGDGPSAPPAYYGDVQTDSYGHAASTTPQASPNDAHRGGGWSGAQMPPRVDSGGSGWDPPSLIAGAD